MKNKTAWLLVLGAAGLVALYLYMRHRNQQSVGGAQSPTGGLGTNLNSVAPELVGGSSGPSLGPAVSLPITISLTQPGGSADNDKPPYQSVGHTGDMNDEDGRWDRDDRRDRDDELQGVNPGGPMRGLDGGDGSPNPGGPERGGPPTRDRHLPQPWGPTGVHPRA